MHPRASLVLKAELNGSEWLLLVLWTLVLPDVGCRSSPIHLLAVSPGEMLHMTHSDLNSSIARNEFLFVTGWTLQRSLFSPRASKFPGSICSSILAHRSCSPCPHEVFIFPGGMLDRKASGGAEWGTRWMVFFITTAPVATCWRCRWSPHVIYTMTQQLNMLTQPHAVSEGGIISLPCWDLWRGQHCICILQHHNDPKPQKLHQSYFQKAI